MAYEKLFEKGRIGSIRLKNRVVMPAMGVNLATPTGEANEDIIAYYEERAKGGVGLIITEICRVDDETGVGLANQISATGIQHIPHLARLADRVHKYGTKILLQLQHPGRETHAKLNGGRQIVAPSAVMCKVTKEMPREMTTEECEALVKAYIKSAVIAKNAGFDGVEIHCAHGYLLNEFLSPYTNKRIDKYGGSFDNRIRIVEEIILGTRHMCGKDFVLSVRISADEFVDGGLKIEDTIKIARVLESEGIDVINVSSGIYESMPTAVEPGSYAQAWKKHLAAAIRRNVKIPVIAVNNIKEPAVAESLLEEGVCDYVAVGRGHLADPEWVNKAKTGREQEINKCIGCLYCFSSLGEGQHVRCAVNPRCGREVEYSRIEQNGNGKKVAIIGGGPAGMQAALTLKERGFEPVIFEKEAVLGGQLNIADKPILKDKLHAYKNSMIYRVEHYGIETRLGAEATIEAVREIEPVGIFVAAGGSPIVPELPGIHNENVITAVEALTGKKEVRGKVAVIGGGITGIEAAETFAEYGHEVTIVEMLSTIGKGVAPAVLADHMSRLQKQGVAILTGHRLTAIKETTAKLVDMRTTKPIELETDTVVVALGTRPNRSVVDQFETVFPDLIVLGDANKDGRIVEAAYDGFSRAMTF